MDPHDCVLLDDRRTLCITNAGAPLGQLGEELEASVTLVDSETQKLVQRFGFGDPKINAGHVAIRTDKSFAVVSAPRAGLDEVTSLGGITLRAAPKKPERMREPKGVTQRLVGETLSVAIVDDTVVATTPTANLVTFWSLSRGKHLGALEIEFPRGVLACADGAVIVTHGKALPRAVVVDLESRTVRANAPQVDGVCSGSHVFRFAPM